MSSPKRFEWMNMNLDTGAEANTFTIELWSRRSRDVRFYRTASGEWILDGGAWQFQGYDENCLLRSVNDSLECTKFCAVPQRLRAKDDKISTWDMMVDT